VVNKGKQPDGHVDIEHRFVFICGLHRSGTSPLFQILREHPDISGFRNTNVPEDEGQHLQSVFPTAKVYGGPGRFGFSPEAHLTELSACITSQNKYKLFAEWSKYWDLNKPLLLEKSPPNLIRTRFLQAMFPDSYFIVITRHPIAVSLATWKWAGTSLESLVRHWLHCHRLFEQDSSYLRRVLLIRYEDLIRESENTLRRTCNFLGISALSVPSLNPAGNARYFAAWQKLSEHETMRAIVKHIVAKYDRKCGEYGYSLVEMDSIVSPG
jgi:Sulfotransferase family